MKCSHLPLLLLAACGGSPEPSPATAPGNASGLPGASAPAEPAPLWPAGASKPAKNAVLIVLDTTRDRAVRTAHTPTLDALTASGSRTDRTWAGGTWTVPSVVSLLTGRFVRHHGWDHPSARMGQYPPLPDVPRIAEVLKQAGFTTHGLYSNPYLSEPLGFDRGFDSWKRTSDRQMAKVLGKVVQRAWTADGRHFAYVHLLGPHSPLKPSEAARERWKVDADWFEGKHGFMVGEAKRNQKDGVREAYKAAYHAAIEDTDTLMAGILEALGTHRSDTLVVVTSDHGELLGEHGHMGHGWWLWEELSHVPLIVDHPHLDGEQESLPTVLSNVAVPDLLTRGLGVDAVWPVSLQDAPLLASRRDGREAVAFDGQTKLMWDDRINGTAPIRFDLATDPTEADPKPPTADELALWAPFQERFPEAGPLPGLRAPVDPATAEELKVLGYVDP